jgi:hypothetical protein
MRELKEPFGPFSLDCPPGYRSRVLSCMARAHAAIIDPTVTLT